jgi:phage minor structural protein
LINIYNADETDFENNGLAVLDTCIKAKVSEELNGIYDITLEYPLFGNNKWQYLIEDNIIKAPTPKGTQLFRIVNKNKTMSSIEVYARHIFYDLLYNFLEDVRPTNLNGAGALNWILNNTQYSHSFKGYSDLLNTGTAYYVRKNPIESILGSDDNSYLKVWGGEVLRDNFKIHINGAIGEDRGYTISWGKNLQGINDKTDYSNVITKVMPIGRDVNDNPLLLPEKYIDSLLINNYFKPKIKDFDFPNIKVITNPQEGETAVTQDQVYEQLRQQGKLLFSEQNIDKPILDAEIDFIELSKTEEYKDYSILQQIYLGDTLTCKHEKIGINLKAKAVKYTWDAIREKYINITLADATANNAESVTINIPSVINNIHLSIDQTKQITDKLKNALGGYVVKRDGEILIMDTKDIRTATKVWRWNLNGLGYSSTGYNGAYGVAITMDGEIVADFIKTGILDASLIKTGIIQSSDGSFQLSLTSGHMTTYSDGKVAIDIFNQTVAWHDWQGDAGLTGQIASNRILDAQGNPTGKQVLSIQVPHGVMLDLASIDEDAKSPVIRIDNYASDSERQKITMHIDDLYITPKNAPDYGMTYIDGQLKLGSHIDMNGYGFKNLGKMNMSTGTGTSDDGWTGTITLNGVTITVTNGAITNAVS